MLKYILLCFCISLTYTETVIKTKDNLESISENETNLTLELKHIIF